MASESRENRPGGPPVLLTGATGYIGGRLLPLLLRDGWRVRCLVRRRASARLPRDPRVEVTEADVLRADGLAGAMEGAGTAFYLIHSMGTSRDFEAADRRAARNFALAAGRAGVRRIIYLGGLGGGGGLSAHLRSRQEVGRILRQSGAQVIELRASIVIGSGSLSFELVRALVERLPVMVCPRWVRTLAQPIGIRDVLACLLAAMALPQADSRVLEIGGPDPVSYADIMRAYAQARGLRRLMVPVPVLTPWLSSLWLALVTPVMARVGRKLIEGVRSATVVGDPAGMRALGVRPAGLGACIREALAEEDRLFAGAALSGRIPDRLRRKARACVRQGNRLLDSRRYPVGAPPPAAFAPIRRIGGKRGWYSGDWLWSVRGWLDRLLGGPGMRRARRSADEVRVGDSIDCWRVVAHEPDRRLRLEAQMRLPGRAWLEFEVTAAEGGSTIRQTAVFDPLGLRGLAYWYALYPLHCLMFDGMLRGIARRARRARDRA